MSVAVATKCNGNNNPMHHRVISFNLSAHAYALELLSNQV